MKKGTHGLNELSFEELSYEDQAKTLNAQILGIERGLISHIRRGNEEGKDTIASSQKYIKQLERVISAIN